MALAVTAGAAGVAHAADALSAAALAHLRDTALHADYAESELFILTNQIGARPAGSPAAQAAATQVSTAMRVLGLEVHDMPVTVPRWVRGEERATLLEYPGQPTGVERPIAVAALGNSPATSDDGLEAPLLVVHSYDELQLHAKAARGRIVLFDVPFSQRLADNGYAATAYARAAGYRLHGPAAAARLGAVAALVRSAGGAENALLHTGSTLWSADDPAQIPAATVTAEDATLLAQLAAKGTVRMRLLLKPQTLPPAPDRNVIADLRGTNDPSQIVVVSAHLDSWDLGSGAQDDAVGVAVTMGVAAVLRQLNLRPRRTIRFIAWANEENGLSGALAYRREMASSLADHVAAIENDTGAGQPFGIAAQITPDSMPLLAPVFDALTPMGTSILVRSAHPVAADIAPLNAAGVPGFAPLVDMRHYFDVHHSAADTLDKIDPIDVRRQVAVEAVLAWWLANADALPRIPLDPQWTPDGDVAGD
ncbi:MAG TPA: M20/M25/M40 family metallo-hydrolase [Nevskiaceae bacterium]